MLILYQVANQECAMMPAAFSLAGNVTHLWSWTIKQCASRMIGEFTTMQALLVTYNNTRINPVYTTYKLRAFRSLVHIKSGQVNILVGRSKWCLNFNTRQQVNWNINVCAHLGVVGWYLRIIINYFGWPASENEGFLAISLWELWTIFVYFT